MTLAKIITKARKAKNWTPAEFARQVDARRSSVHAWEHGDCNPSLDRIGEIAEKLELDPDELLAVAVAERISARRKSRAS